MSDSRVNDFFYSGNAVHGEPDYGLADNFVRTAEAFANTTYQSVYIIDYFRKNFLYVSPNPLFLCGMSADAVKSEGYRFYIDHVPADEVDMLLEINKAGFSFINDVPLEEKLKYTMNLIMGLFEQLYEQFLEFNNLTPAQRYLQLHDRYPRITETASYGDIASFLSISLRQLQTIR